MNDDEVDKRDIDGISASVMDEGMVFRLVLNKLKIYRECSGDLQQIVDRISCSW